jgi:hypothetical protein
MLQLCQCCNCANAVTVPMLSLCRCCNCANVRKIRSSINFCKELFRRTHVTPTQGPVADTKSPTDMVST